MKFRVTFKTPDAVDVESIVNQLFPQRQDGDEDDLEYESAHDKVRSCVEKFVKYGEVITVEFDIENGTCIVVPVKG